MLGAAVPAPHQTLHLSLLSSAQGLREPWGRQDAEGSSLIDDRQGVKSRRRGREGEARRGGAVLSQNSIYTSARGKDERKE